MNFIDIGILLILAITILGGYYRGFVYTVCSVVATVVSFVLSAIGAPLIANAIKGQDKLFSMLLYYTEGSEYVAATDVELTRMPISNVSAETLHTVIENADMPLPMDRCVLRNIASEAFQADGIATLGDYFNQTIVSVVINIVSVLILFVILRLILGFVIRGMDYGRDGFPVLQRADGAIGAGLGLLHGVLMINVLFLVVPIGLTVLPKIYEYLGESFFGEFFYKANICIPLISGT